MRAVEREFVVLLVDDSPNDIVLAQFATEKADLEWRLFEAPDGEAAVNYLSGNGRYADRDKYPLPKLMLIDLKMPKLDGFRLLEWIQKHSEFDDISTVVLSSSNIESDMSRAQALGADDYRVKPNDYHELISI